MQRLRDVVDFNLPKTCDVCKKEYTHRSFSVKGISPKETKWFKICKHCFWDTGIVGPFLDKQGEVEYRMELSNVLL